MDNSSDAMDASKSNGLAEAQETTEAASPAAPAPAPVSVPTPAETAAVLRAFAANILRPSRNERKVLFDATWAHIANVNVVLPDAAVKGLCRLLPSVLSRFHDGSSRFHAYQGWDSPIFKKNS
jgi:hypothetical protein